MGKRNGKRKKKRNSQLAGPGGEFRPSERGRPSRPTEERSGTGGRHGRGPTCQREEGGNGVERATDGGGGRTGRARPPVRSAVVLRWEPDFATEEWWRGTGGVGDHGGRSNLAGGCLGWLIHDAVAGARGGEVADEAAERNRRRRWVHCVCGGKANLKNYIN
jgi:hypothetical protein